jgi:hypothetical protein
MAVNVVPDSRFSPQRGKVESSHPGAEQTMAIGVERSSPPARKLLSRRGYHGAIRPVDPGVLLWGFFTTRPDIHGSTVLTTRTTLGICVLCHPRHCYAGIAACLTDRAGAPVEWVGYLGMLHARKDVGEIAGKGGE